MLTSLCDCVSFRVFLLVCVPTCPTSHPSAFPCSVCVYPARVPAHVCARMCVCLHVCVCNAPLLTPQPFPLVCVSTQCVCLHMCAHMCVHMCVFLHMCVHMCVYVCVHVHMCVSAHVCVCNAPLLTLQLFPLVCVCTCVCLQVCVCVCVCTCSTSHPSEFSAHLLFPFPSLCATLSRLVFCKGNKIHLWQVSYLQIRWAQSSVLALTCSAEAQARLGKPSGGIWKERGTCPNSRHDWD